MSCTRFAKCVTVRLVNGQGNGCRYSRLPVQSGVLCGIQTTILDDVLIARLSNFVHYMRVPATRKLPNKLQVFGLHVASQTVKLLECKHSTLILVLVAIDDIVNCSFCLIQLLLMSSLIVVDAVVASCRC